MRTYDALIRAQMVLDASSAHHHLRSTEPQLHPVDRRLHAEKSQLDSDASDLLHLLAEDWEERPD